MIQGQCSNKGPLYAITQCFSKMIFPGGLQPLSSQASVSVSLSEPPSNSPVLVAVESREEFGRTFSLGSV